MTSRERMACARRVIESVEAAFPGRPIYTHTCGANGDRPDLIETHVDCEAGGS
jgi:hypothetical protein